LKLHQTNLAYSYIAQVEVIHKSKSLDSVIISLSPCVPHHTDWDIEGKQTWRFLPSPLCYSVY